MIKWEDLLPAARRDSRLIKNPPTGGGWCYSTIIMEFFGEYSPVFNGLNGPDSTEVGQEIGQTEAATHDALSDSQQQQSDGTSHERKPIGKRVYT